MSDQPTVVYQAMPPDQYPTPPPIPTAPPPPIVPNGGDSQPTYFTNPSNPIYPTRPTLPTGGGGGGDDSGGGGNNPEPDKPTSSQASADTTTASSESDRPEQTTTTSSQQQQTTSTPPAAGNGGVTLQPGVPTSFRGVPTPTTSPSSASGAAAGISGSVISGSMTAVVFIFAFLGALIIGLVAGFLIAKYTRLGGSRKRKEQKDQLTEQLRLLTESIGQQNAYNQHHSRQQQHPQERSFNLDRSYLQEDRLTHAPYQAELTPLYMNRSYAAYPTTTAAALNLSHPHSAPDQHIYQNWDAAVTPLITPGTPMVSIRPATIPTPAAAAAVQVVATSRTPRLGNTAIPLPHADVEIDGPKDEWASSRAESTISLSSKSVSASELNGFERRRPQHRVEGEGEDSLFGEGLDVVTHNPHSISRIE
ncbi:hypothetical protein KI688_002164 [Linnemannia hyalina]|uniref:Uncharacterized protein n=1 Tax=Linnemannia hyalina TaxID=64524 RepID=A0A9P7XRP6_9FUNG|nr:hypothetical protein KI688_002164 [Linnemannia hyalina]